MEDTTPPANYRVTRETQPTSLPQLHGCVSYFTNLFFKHLVGVNVWIAGGALRDWFETGQMTESDVDFFSNSRADLCKTLLMLRKKYKFRPYHINKRVIKGWVSIGKNNIKIDLIKILFETPEHTIDQFDFTVCCFAVDKNKVTYHQSAPFDLLHKRLVINNLPFPVSTLQRIQKYLKKGYWICNGGILEIAKAMGSVDFNDPTQNNIEMYPDGTPRFVRID